MNNTFNIEGIVKELKRVRWPKFKGDQKAAGVLENTIKVLCFIGVLALVLTLGDLVTSLLMM